MREKEALSYCTISTKKYRRNDRKPPFGKTPQ